jgi:hypothetical protein
MVPEDKDSAYACCASPSSAALVGSMSLYCCLRNGVRLTSLARRSRRLKKLQNVMAITDCLPCSGNLKTAEEG